MVVDRKGGVAMKKKLMALLLCLIFAFTLVGCNTKNKTNIDFSKTKSTKSTVTKDNESMDMKYHRYNSK